MEETYDVVVVGAGGAGMTAALAAAEHGLDTVLIEKSAYFGGSTARSGGGVWIPGNRALKAAGQVSATDRQEASDYLQAIVGDEVPKDPPRDVPRPWTRGHRLPPRQDPASSSSGCRATPTTSPSSPAAARRDAASSPIPMDGRILGDELDRLHPPYAKAPANLIVTQADFRKISLGLRTIRGPLTMMRVVFMRDDQLAARSQDVRDGQRPDDQPAQGAGRRQGAGLLRDRADRTRHRERPSRRRTRRARRQGGRHPCPPRRDPRLRRLREERSAAREVPPDARPTPTGAPPPPATPARASKPASPSAQRPT